MVSNQKRYKRRLCNFDKNLQRIKDIRFLLIFFFISLILFNQHPLALGQKVKTEVIVHDDFFWSEQGFVPLPKNAVELELRFSFQYPELKHPFEMADDSSGNIFITDDEQNAVFKFNSSGEYLSQFGQQGKGPSEFFSPQNILLTKNLIAVQELKNKRIQFLDLEGKPLKSIKIYKDNIQDIAINNDGFLFIAKSLSIKDTTLVDVFSPQGKLLYSFGEAFKFIPPYPLLNSRKLTLNRKGEILVAFTYFPLVRKYSQKGELLAEYDIENNIMKAKEKMNLTLMGKARLNKFHYGYTRIIIAMKVFEDKVYLLSNYPRLEILEINEEGKIINTYWKDSDALYKPDDLLAQKIGNKKIFYVLQSAPEIAVDVFSPKH
jgi:hypothetical protein